MTQWPSPVWGASTFDLTGRHFLPGFLGKPREHLIADIYAEGKLWMRRMAESVVSIVSKEDQAQRPIATRWPRSNTLTLHQDQARDRV